jgi:hypothetical protein
MRTEVDACNGQKFDRFFKQFPALTDENKQLVLGTACKLAEVQGAAASTLEGQECVRAAAARL